eukprot:UN31045
MELLGDCLGEVRKQCDRVFSEGTLLRMSIELIELSEKVHNCGILHRDCKLKNYLLGPNNEGSIYLVDFGLSDNWRDDKTGEHIEFDTKLPPYGTMRYAPIAVHKGYEQGRKDDLEALGYMLIYMAKGKLPWQNLWHEDKKIVWRDVGKMKKELTIKELCKGLRPCFEKFMVYLGKLKFSDQPQYKLLAKYFLDELKKLRLTRNVIYDWEQNNEESTEEDEVSDNMAVDSPRRKPE